MGKTKIGVGGNLEYMGFLVERYGKDADMKTVWEGEQKRLSQTLTVVASDGRVQKYAQNQNSNK